MGSPLEPTSLTLGAATVSVSSLSGLIGVAAFFFFAFLAIFWIALVFWTWRDVRSRTQDVILQVTATLLVAVFSIGGLFIYLIVRPRQTLAELYERQLEEESLLAEMTERQTCPTCHYRVEGDFHSAPPAAPSCADPAPAATICWNSSGMSAPSVATAVARWRVAARPRVRLRASSDDTGGALTSHLFRSPASARTTATRKTAPYMREKPSALLFALSAQVAQVACNAPTVCSFA